MPLFLRASLLCAYGIIVDQMAGSIRAKPGTQIYLDPGFVLDKSRF